MPRGVQRRSDEGASGSRLRQAAPAGGSSGPRPADRALEIFWTLNKARTEMAANGSACQLGRRPAAAALLLALLAGAAAGVDASEDGACACLLSAMIRFMKAYFASEWPAVTWPRCRRQGCTCFHHAQNPAPCCSSCAVKCGRNAGGKRCPDPKDCCSIYVRGAALARAPAVPRCGVPAALLCVHAPPCLPARRCLLPVGAVNVCFPTYPAGILRHRTPLLRCGQM